MDKAILLTRLTKCEDENNELYQCYKDATKKYFDTEEKKFNQLIKDIKYLSNIQYDFSKLSEGAKSFDITRRDYRELCDMVCMIIGDSISDLCNHTRNGIITSPSKFEDYCPFYSNDLVVYGNSDNKVFLYEGKKYYLIETKVEETPYYTIHCSSIEI